MLVRKTVTVLFCDVVTSTELGERLDPESLRQVMTRWFDEMRTVIERHGGTVEKFIGDEVMAVYGVPVVHEDDALRAVRAAGEMRDRLETLNEELEAGWGIRLQARTGINTGEVVAGDPATAQTFVTGEPVVLAKRLEQAAAPGEILIGKATYPLVKDAVSAGPLESFSVKGKAELISPLRLDAVEAGVPGLARRLDAPLVGRQAELDRLRAELERVEEDRTCRLVTVLGPAGIGKSRLAAELVSSCRDRATALTGRCLPYGDGITFWPLTEIVSDAGGEAGLAAALAGIDDGPLIAERVRSAIGASQAPAETAETFWAVRRFFEVLAAERSLVIVLEDIHWAEPTLLDLVEYLVGWSVGAPILLLCLARRDFLEARPDWTAPRPNATALALDPLSRSEADALLERVPNDGRLDDKAREQIAAAAEGNPLFLEQMAALALEESDSAGPLAVPPSIQALLAERLDRLGTEERTIIERAAVVGKDFASGAVTELCPPEVRPSVGRHLMALVRKELVRPDPAFRGREDGFRFRHVLIRDAAYEGLPKEVRADLHERFAARLEREPARAGELEEIIGYHLEQAYQQRIRLSRVDPAAQALGTRASARLASAGRRAFARGDMPAAVSLLTRATVLVANDDRAHLEIATDLALALIDRGDLEQAEGVLDRTLHLAAELGDRDAEAHALVGRGHLIAKADPTGAFEEVQSLADRAIATFGEIGDERGLAQAWRLVALSESWRCHWGAMTDALEHALAHAERDEDERERAGILHWLGVSRYYGPTPVDTALSWCEEALGQTSHRAVQAIVTALRGGLLAMQGRFVDARESAARSIVLLEELGALVKAGHARCFAGEMEMLAGDAAAAEHAFREGYETLRRAGDHNGALNAIFELAEALYGLERYDEAEQWVAAGSSDRDRSDWMIRVVGMGIEAQLLARRGRLEEGERLSAQAIALADETDAPNLQGGALLSRAEVLRLADDPAAAVCIERAVDRFEAKGNVAASTRARAAIQGAAAGADATPRP